MQVHVSVRKYMLPQIDFVLFYIGTKEYAVEMTHFQHAVFKKRSSLLIQRFSHCIKKCAILVLGRIFLIWHKQTKTLNLFYIFE